MLQFVPDVEAADRDHEGRRRGCQGADDDAADQHGPEDQEQGTIVRLSEHAVIHRDAHFFGGRKVALYQMKSHLIDCQHNYLRPAKLADRVPRIPAPIDAPPPPAIIRHHIAEGYEIEVRPGIRWATSPVPAEES